MPSMLAMSGILAAGILFGLIGGFLLLLFTVALIEKRLAEPYLAATEDTALPPYVVSCGQELHRRGFEYGGILQHAKMAIKATTWFSPDRTILALTGAGKVGPIPTQQTWLFTPLSDGRLLVTTDRNDEGDISGLHLIRRRLNSPFPELLHFHEQRIAKEPDQICSFPEASPLDAVLAVYSERTARLIELGRARYLDDGQQRWRYTAKGGLHVCTAFFGQLFDAFRQFQSWRVGV